MSLNNPAGLFALLALIPFIILYLIKPKPRNQMIPSLMFFMEQKRKIKENAFFRKLMNNLLFLLQLLALLGLIFAIASPYMIIPYDESVQKTIIVIDASSSMSARSGSGTRFSKAISEAKKHLTGDVSIILAENIPIVLLENQNPSTAVNILNNLEPMSTTTSIGDAMLLSSEIADGKKARLYVISDFSNYDGTDIFVAKRVLESKDIKTNFVDVSSEANNVGIIDLVIDTKTVKATVKNYHGTEITAKLKLSNSGRVITTKSITLGPDSKEAYILDVPEGITELILETDDDYSADNTAYISIPESKEIDILLITNQEASHLMAALQAPSNVNLEIRNPPVTNAYNIGHDIVVIDKINRKLFVPADFVDIKKYVDKGGKLVITAQDDLLELDTKGLLPVDISHLKEQKGIACVDTITPITSIFEEDLCFAGVNKYLAANSQEQVLASIEGSPIFVYKKQGSGQVFYYGIFDQDSAFKTSPNYPIFCYQLINFLERTPDLNDFNIRTGQVLSINSGEVKTPTKTLEVGSILVDEAGIYEIDGNSIASNLLDEIESDLGKTVDIETKESNFIEKDKEIEFKLDLNNYLLMLVALILLIEVIYLKRRGSL